MNKQQLIVNYVNTARERYTTTVVLRANNERLPLNSNRIKEDLAAITKVAEEYGAKVAEFLQGLENLEIEKLRGERGSTVAATSTDIVPVEAHPYKQGKGMPWHDQDVEAPHKNIA